LGKFVIAPSDGGTEAKMDGRRGSGIESWGYKAWGWKMAYNSQGP